MSIWTADNPKANAYKGSYYVHGELHGQVFTTRPQAEQAISQAPALGTCDGVPLAYTVEESSIEHRENYSMGGGNYLGVSKYSGWIVKSYSLEYNGYRSDVLETEHLEALHAQRNSAPAAVVSAPETCAAGVALSENEEKDGLEIRFDAKPAPELLARLKAAGWRWSRFSSCWYTRRTDSARQFAQQFLGGAQ